MQNSFVTEQNRIHTFLYKQHFYNQRQINWQKIKQMVSNTLRLNFCYLKIIDILHSRYHPTIIGHILKNKQKNKCVCINEIIRLIVIENENENKKQITYIRHKPRTRKNRPRSRHERKYGKCKKCLSMMTPISY